MIVSFTVGQGQHVWKVAPENEHLYIPLRDLSLHALFYTLHNEGLHKLYSLPNIIRRIMSRRMRWAGHVARMGEKRNAWRVLVGKRPLGRPRLQWGIILIWI
jgi:hypothetical protein